MSAKWPLLEQLPSGHLKENLTKIEKSMEEIEKTAKVLITLANWEHKAEQETVTMATNTLFAAGCAIDACTDSVFYHLNQIFEKGTPEQARSVIEVYDNPETLPRSSQEAPELSAYEPGIANAKISIVSLWKHLEVLDTIINDSSKIAKWGENILAELWKCQVA
jgi:hypothetical protein